MKLKSIHILFGTLTLFAYMFYCLIFCTTAKAQSDKADCKKVELLTIEGFKDNCKKAELLTIEGFKCIRHDALVRMKFRYAHKMKKEIETLEADVKKRY